MFLTGDSASALPYLVKAAELVPNHPEILDHLAQAYADLGQMQRARETWKRALSNGVENELSGIIRKRLEALP